MRVLVLSHGWKLADLGKAKPNGIKVLSTFSGGGGSSMGYKLAGFDVIGGVEIDSDMAAAYRTNLKTDVWGMPISEFTKKHAAGIKVDILDGSPPCSVFSLAGKREKGWGIEKKFAEGQALQRLDNLFFEYIELARVLRPKVCVAENVTGMLVGKAKGYVLEIFQAFETIGYKAQLFKLNAAMMGVPQSRQRIFFIAQKKGSKPVSLAFDAKPITASEAIKGVSAEGAEPLSGNLLRLWKKVRPGQSLARAHNRGSFFNNIRCSPARPFPTITAANRPDISHWDTPRTLSPAELTRAQSFPDDYDYGAKPVKYICGMSVPPRMMETLSREIARQVF